MPFVVCCAEKLLPTVLQGAGVPAEDLRELGSLCGEVVAEREKCQSTVGVGESDWRVE